MALLGSILIGFFVGVLAKWLHPGKERMGFVLTVLLGIGGSMLATFGGQFLNIYAPGEKAGFIGAVLGAVVLLALYGALAPKARGGDGA